MAEHKHKHYIPFENSLTVVDRLEKQIAEAVERIEKLEAQAKVEEGRREHEIEDFKTRIRQVFDSGDARLTAWMDSVVKR